MVPILGGHQGAVTGVVVGSSSSVSPAARRVGATAAASGTLRFLLWGVAITLLSDYDRYMYTCMYIYIYIKRGLKV